MSPAPYQHERRDRDHLAKSDKGSSHFSSLPLRELGPATPDEILGILGGHLDGAIGGDVEAPAREGLHGPDAARSTEANPKAFSVVLIALRIGQFFGFSSLERRAVSRPRRLPRPRP